MSLSLYQVQQGIYSKLRGDGVLMGMVQGVYDVVPKQVAFPYLVIGDGIERTLAASEIDGLRCEMVIELFSRAKGRKEALLILDRIYALLHRQVVTVDGVPSLVVRIARAETEMMIDGVTVRGTLRLLLILAQEVV